MTWLVPSGLMGRKMSCLTSRDENGSETNRYHICFHISTISDKIELYVNIINIRFKYSDTNTISGVKYSDSNYGQI